MSGWASRTCSSRHARVSGTSTPTRRNSDRTWAGLRRSATVPAGAWRSTSASRASRWAAASAVDRGRGPTMAPMIASAAARSTGRPLRPSSTHSTSAADSARAVAPTWRWSATSAASCACWALATCNASWAHVAARSADDDHSPAGHCGRRWPSGPIGSASSAGVGPWSKRSGGWARGTVSGSSSWASAQTTAGSARHPPWSRRCTAARSKARAIVTSSSTAPTDGADHHTHRGPIVDSRCRTSAVSTARGPAALTATMPWAGVATRATGSPRPAGVTRARAARARTRPDRRAGCSRRRSTPAARRG